jgi:hypothetical protein
VRLTNAERKAKHAEANKQLWEAAYVLDSDKFQSFTLLSQYYYRETPERPIFLEARAEVPLKSDFKPTMKVLSRKPPPKVADATRALGNASLDDDPDSEEEERRKAEKSFVERQLRAQREREEKQRKYQEVRERLFGTSRATAGDDQSRPPSANNESRSRNSSRGKGKGRGGRLEADSSSSVPADDSQSPARTSNSRKQLFDPTYSAKPNSTYLQRKEREALDSGGSGTSTPAEEKAVIRSPRGPDSSGRGGFGFAQRGNRTGANHET